MPSPLKHLPSRSSRTSCRLFRLLCLLSLLCACLQPTRSESPAQLADVLEARVLRIHDGDTIVVRTSAREETVRLLGVDCPEIAHPQQVVEHFGPQATAFTRSLVEGTTVELRIDPLADRRDKYGRLLRYVTLEDGRTLNALLIEEGYCRVIEWFPFEEREAFTRLQAAARRAARGLWQVSTAQEISAPRDGSRSALISWKEAEDYYGQTVTVAGKVVAAKNTGKACFLNFHPDWKRTFTAVIFASDFGRFPSAPEDLFLGREVRVTGRVREYRGKPEMVIEAPSQIRIVDGD